MQPKELVPLIGLLLCLLGTGFLAFALNRIVAALSMSADAQELTQEAEFGRGPIPVFRGLDVHRRAAARRAGALTWAGLVAIAAGTVCQAIGLFM